MKNSELFSCFYLFSFLLIIYLKIFHSLFFIFKKIIKCNKQIINFGAILARDSFHHNMFWTYFVNFVDQNFVN